MRRLAMVLLLCAAWPVGGEELAGWVALPDAVDAVLDGRMRNGILAIGLLAAARRRSKE